MIKLKLIQQFGKMHIELTQNYLLGLYKYMPKQYLFLYVYPINCIFVNFFGAINQDKLGLELKKSICNSNSVENTMEKYILISSRRRHDQFKLRINHGPYIYTVCVTSRLIASFIPHSINQRFIPFSIPYFTLMHFTKKGAIPSQSQLF